MNTVTVSKAAESESDPRTPSKGEDCTTLDLDGGSHHSHSTSATVTSTTNNGSDRDHLSVVTGHSGFFQKMGRDSLSSSSSHHHKGSRHSHHSQPKIRENCLQHLQPQDKVEIIIPTSSMSCRTSNKLEQFNVEKLVQNRRRLNQLYGREAEINMLQRELGEVCQKNVSHRSLVLVYGLSGEGKTALAMQLKGPATKTYGAFFVSGKFDLAQIGEPYSGIKKAIRNLCSEIKSLPTSASETISTLGQGGNALTFQGLQNAVMDKLDWELDFLCQFIPELSILSKRSMRESLRDSSKLGGSIRNILSNQISCHRINAIRQRSGIIAINESSRSINTVDSNTKPGGISSNKDAYTNQGKASLERLHFALRRLVNVISGFAPLVFLCDDAQFADSASINLLKSWVTDQRNQSLMVIWTYRSNMVGPDHFVTKAVQDIKAVQQDRNISILPIQIGNLHPVDVNKMVSDMLDLSTDVTEELATMITHKTAGNVFFIIQYLMSLAQKRLLTYNMTFLKWTWDVEEVRAGLTATDNVVDLMKDKLGRNALARSILPLAACLGATFDLWVLQEVIRGIPTIDNVRVAQAFATILGADFCGTIGHSELSQIEKAGLIEAAGLDSFSFIHDKVIEGAISLIPSDQIDVLKFGIGYILFQRIDTMEENHADEILFLVVNLLNMRLDLIPEDRKISVSHLNIFAGDQAHIAAAHKRSAIYYAAAKKLLPQNHWAIMYDDSLHLFTHAAQAEMCLGNYENMKTYSDEVIKQKSSLLDKMVVYECCMDALLAQAKIHEAWNLGFEVLEKAGFKFPQSAITTRTLCALARIYLSKKKWKSDALSKLPQCEDPIHGKIIEIYHRQIILAILVNPTAIPLLIVSSSEHVLKHGLDESSSDALAWLGLIIQGVFGDTPWCVSHMEYVHSLVEQFGNPLTVPRVSSVHNVFLVHWSNPIHNSQKLHIAAYSKGMECCDTDSAFWAAHFYLESCLYSGVDLVLLEKDAEMYGKQMMDYGMFKHLQCLESVWQLILNLQGKSSNTTVLTGSVHNEVAALKMADDCSDTHHRAHVCKDSLFAAAFFGDWERGAELGVKHCEAICETLVSQHSVVVSRFITGISCFVQARRSGNKKHFRIAMRNLKIMKNWFARGNPNTQHLLLFLEAEKAVYKGKTKKALSLYERTILLSARAGYNHDQALASGRLASLLLSVGDKRAAKQRLEDTLMLYREWGASSRAAMVEDEIRSLTS